MYNQNSSDQKSFGAPTSPRISFSNNLFVESIANAHHHHHHDRPHYSPVSSDFEFSSSVTNCSAVMSGADELFSNGKLLPFKQGKKTTLRDELLAGEEETDFSLKPPKSSAKWKGLLGLRKSHIGSKKVYKNDDKTTVDVHGTKNSQEAYYGGGSSFAFKG